MNKKIDVEVVIGGKPYTLSGYESSDYLQRIAMHINGKIAEFRAQEGYARLETELKNVLLAINLSDDYQKAQNTIRELKQDNEDMEKELFDMKHEMISMQRELQEAKDAVKKLEQEKESEEHRAIRLETELEQLRKEIAKEVVQKEETVDVAADTKPSAELTATRQTAPENADKEETVEKQDVAEDVTHSEDTEAAVTVEQTDNVAEENVAQQSQEKTVINITIIGEGLGLCTTVPSFLKYGELDDAE